MGERRGAWPPRNSNLMVSISGATCKSSRSTDQNDTRLSASFDHLDHSRLGTTVAEGGLCHGVTGHGVTSGTYVHGCNSQRDGLPPMVSASLPASRAHCTPRAKHRLRIFSTVRHRLEEKEVRVDQRLH